MKTKAIIEAAARNAGIPLPLDRKTARFSKSFLRSLGNVVSYANGKRKPNKKNIHDFLAEMQRKADKL